MEQTERVRPGSQGRLQNAASLVVALPGLQGKPQANGGNFPNFAQVPDCRRDPAEADGGLERPNRQIQPLADQHVVAQGQQKLQVERKVLQRVQACRQLAGVQFRILVECRQETVKRLQPLGRTGRRHLGRTPQHFAGLILVAQNAMGLAGRQQQPWRPISGSFRLRAGQGQVALGLGHEPLGFVLARVTKNAARRLGGLKSGRLERRTQCLANPA